MLPHDPAQEAIGIAWARAKRNAANNIGLRPLFGVRAAKVLGAADGSRNSRRFTAIAVGAGRRIRAGRSLRFW